MQHIAHREEGGVVLDAVVLLHTTSRSLKQDDQFRGDFLGLVLVVVLEHIEECDRRSVDFSRRARERQAARAAR